MQQGDPRPPRPETAREIRDRRIDQAQAGPLGLTLPNGQVVALRPGAFSLGRNRDCDIVLDDIQVSRNHATIRITVEGIHLADVGSTNGTFVNGERIPPHMSRRLEAGDTIRLGQTATLSVGAEPVVAPTPVHPQIQPEPVHLPAAARPVAQPQSRLPEREPQARALRRQQPGWTMWLWWVLASVVGRALGRIATDATIRLEPWIDAWSRDWPGVWPVFAAVIWATFGLVLGLAQWLVLRPRIRRAGWWVVATALGNGLAHLLGGPLVMPLVEMVSWEYGWEVGDALHGTLVGGLAGILIGIAQWLMLRRHARKAAWWIPLSAIALLVTLGVDIFLRPPDYLIVVLARVGVGAVIAMITGTVLVRMLRNPPTNQPAEREGMKALAR